MNLKITELDSKGNQTEYIFPHDKYGMCHTHAFVSLVIRFMSIKRDCTMKDALKAFRKHFPDKVSAVTIKKLPRRNDGMWINHGTTIFHPLRVDHGEWPPDLKNP